MVRLNLNISLISKLFSNRSFSKFLILISIPTIALITTSLFVFLLKPNQKEDSLNQSSNPGQQDVLGNIQTNQKSTSQTQPSPTGSPRINTTSSNTPQAIINPTNSQSPTEPSQSITASKANFEPEFSVSLANPQASTHSDINLEYGSSNGNWYGLGIKTSIPAGFDVAVANQIGQNAIVGQGEVIGKLNGQDSTSKFTVYNQTDTAGHKARWLMKFENKVYGEKSLLVDGNITSGHIMILDEPIGLELISPVSIKFTIVQNVVTNPQSPGVFEWKVEYLFSDGVLEVKKETTI